MSRAHCPYCGATDGGRCVPAGNGRFTTECRACGRVTEERLTEVEELFVERAREAPLCIVTPDFTEEKYRAPALEEDPYERIGFITAFSTWSLDLAPLYAVTSSSFSGHLAELERVLSDFLYTPGGGGPGGGTGAPTPAGVSVNMVEALRAYYQIVDVTSVLGLEKDSSDHAVQLFRDCSSTTYLRNRNIEALATAALVQASREAQEPRTLQEISAAANIPQKEIGRHMKVLSDALKLSQPINSNSISVHMPRFCGILQLSKPTQDLATHIGEVVINKSFCTRRNPISISAAAIYLACQLEDKRKTQTEICKATGLTEVTLRKVYKELMENLDDLLPTGYTPAVPPEKAFPVSAAALGRVCATRAAANALGEHSASTSTYSSGANLMSNATSGLGGTDCNVGGSMALLSHPANHVRSSSLVTAGNMSSAGAGVVRVCAPSSMERNPMHLFAMPVSAPVAGNAGGSADSLDQSRLSDAVVKEFVEREKERAESEHVHAFGGLKIMPPAKLNLSTAAPSGAPSFRPPFNPYANIDPRILEMFPLHGPYGLVGMRPEDATLGRGFVDKGREDNAAHIGVAPKGAPQFFNLLPSIGDQGNISALPQAMQLKLAQLANARPPEAAGRERDQQQIMGFDRDTIMLDCDVDRESKRERSDVDHRQIAAASSNTAAAFAAAARASAPPNFLGGFWPAHNPPFGDFGPRVHGPQLSHQGMEKQTAAPTIGDRVSQASGDQLSRTVQNGYPASHVGSEACKQSSSVGDKVISAEASVPAGHPSIQTTANTPAVSESLSMPSGQQKVVSSVSRPGGRGEEVVDGGGGASKGDARTGLQNNGREEGSSLCLTESSVTNPADRSSMATKEANDVACTNSRDMVDGASSVTVSTEPLPPSTDSMISGEAEAVPTLSAASEEKGGYSVGQDPASVADVPGFQSKAESDSRPPASTSANGGSS